MLIITGIDTSRNGILELSEETAEETLCNGFSGSDGIALPPIIVTNHGMFEPPLSSEESSTLDVMCPPDSVATGGGWHIDPDSAFVVNSFPMGMPGQPAFGWSIEFFVFDAADAGVYALCQPTTP